MFTAEQIKEKLSKVKTGADFPVLARNLKALGVTYYETRMEDGSSLYHGHNHYELNTGANYVPIVVADKVNPEQLKKDISNHQQGKTNYFEISRQCADNGIQKWAVCLTTMTCTYFDKSGNEVWIEHIPEGPYQNQPFTAEQIKTAHSKVKSGADFPGYIQEIKALGVTHYETYVNDGHIDYHGINHTINMPAKYSSLIVADTADTGKFKEELKAHQKGKTDFLTFITMCAAFGVAKWEISMDKMTCTYYSKAGHEIMVEQIPQ